MLSVKSLSLTFGGLVAVKELSFSVSAREIVSLIGPNGAGKTSAFNAVSGVYLPSKGSIHLNDTPLNATPHFSDIIRCMLIACVTAIVLPFVANFTTLWQSVIVDHYTIGNSFSWLTALSECWSEMLRLSRSSLLIPSLIGALLGGGGAWIWITSALTSPEAVAQRGVSRTFQNIRLFGELTALDNIKCALDARASSSFFSSALRLPRFYREELQRTAKAEELLEFVGILSVKDRPSASLPYGIQRRLEIARALATNPSLLLLDEPAAGLNPVEAQDLMKLILRIRDRGVTVLLIEHDMKVVMEISDRVVVLHHGEKIAEGTPTEVRSHQRVIDAYLGEGSTHEAER